jgi:serine/threonine-protein kinase
MATVYKIRKSFGDTGSRAFAAKVLRPPFAQDAEARKRFYGEAHCMTGVHSANVIQIVDIPKGVLPCVVMELVDGPSLADLQRDAARRGERLPPSVCIKVAADIARGLQALHDCRDSRGHSLGLVHGNVNSHNILITKDGVAKLTDSGVAKTRKQLGQPDAGAAPDEPESSPSHQVGDNDQRWDVRSLGLVLRDMLDGRKGLPVECEGEIQSSPVLRSVAEQLASVVERSTSADPGDGFQNACEFEQSLESAARACNQIGTAGDVAHYVRELFERRARELEARAHDAPTLVVSIPIPGGALRTTASSNDPEATTLRVVRPAPPTVNTHLRTAIAAVLAAGVTVGAIHFIRLAWARSSSLRERAAPALSGPIAPKAELPSPVETRRALPTPGTTTNAGAPSTPGGGSDAASAAGASSLEDGDPDRSATRPKVATANVPPTSTGTNKPKGLRIDQSEIIDPWHVGH